jgi:hypothetical protein
VPSGEEPGGVSRDGEPARARVLLGVAVGSLAGCVPFVLVSQVVPPAGVACLVLGLAAWLLARRDLSRMRAGLRDARGEELTRLAGRIGLVDVLWCYPLCWLLRVLSDGWPPVLAAYLRLLPPREPFAVALLTGLV